MAGNQGSKRGQLDHVLREYRGIAALNELETQSPLVPPSGPLESPVALVGEAPGADEVTQLAPFVGRAGQYLQHLLSRGGLQWRYLYVTNVILFRPPGNRTPYPYEVAASLTRLEAELDIVRPALIISLGATAWRALSSLMCSDVPYAEARGHSYPYAFSPGHEARLLVTWHPSAALRDRIADDELTETLTQIMRPADDDDRGKADVPA